ncbi:MAG: bifunctional folylpolyglutamate synthase/dihydrofolate synthase [Candidatus Omnitrophica bacterium]|nr:bifunctional folylpolyglutamate synthase/dihydrofolate synthase [Candidatus Omnitrophota bacterium]MBU4487946.1 bifunctional folylpolyglutamate synthase/dihydrofolate synthase [Candidatus Omnitrophota bacterium]MCG2705067.1 bifunctional folylpolyglutamate synthase/dihydrofolate synthase [Candidatus Omnitrophota bacterium]
MTYHEALKYLDSLIDYEKANDFDYKRSFKLDRMKSLSSRLGNPHEGIKAVHVAGTKAKGSVSSFINSILIKAGYKTGMYTSPHLISFRERIRVDGEPISEDNLARLVAKIYPHAEDMAKKNERPTYFEVCTAIAFLYFKERGVDFMVLEVGMGGRLDSTNIVRPLVSVITPISYDHVQHLGPTMRDIASEKCGIIKEKSVVVSSPQNNEAFEVIKSTVEKTRSKFYLVGKDAAFQKIYSGTERQIFNLLTKEGEYPRVEIRLLGEFQIENAVSAVLAVEALRHYEIFVDKVAIMAGLRSARWPGRFEILRKNPLIVVDGAQNGQSAFILKKAVETNLKYKKLFLILGTMCDKDIENICRELSGIADYVIATKSKSGRALSPQFLKERFLHYKNIDAETSDSVRDAIDKALRLAGKDDALLITGSLYVVGEAMEALRKD